MKLIGNKIPQEIFQNFLNIINEKQQIPFNFILLEGLTHIGKTTLVSQFAQEFLGPYFQTDFLHIKDLSDILGKKHSIKIDSDEEIKLPDGATYKDLGTRQMIDWLWIGSFGKYKILFLENINRMSIAAANSFLKNFEEPLQNRLIIASTPSKDLLLDTIVSRAFLVNFHLVSLEEIDKQIANFVPAKQLQIWQEKKNIIYSLAGGKPGKIINILEQIALGEEDISSDLETIERLINIIKSGNGLTEKFHILQDFEKKGNLDLVLETLLNFFQTQGEFDKVQIIASTQNIINNIAVSKDNALFYLALKV